MGLPRPGYEQLVKEREEEHRLAGRDTLRDLAWTSVRLVCCVLFSMFVIGLGVRTTDVLLGRVYFLSGQVLWIASVSTVLLNAYRRGVERGDWR